MNSLRVSATRAHANVPLQFSSSVRVTYGNAVYRRISSQVQFADRTPFHCASRSTASQIIAPLRSKFLPENVRVEFSGAGSVRAFHSGIRLEREKKEEAPAAEKAEETANKTSGEETSGEKESESKQEEGENKKKEQKEEAAPPPPHGDKSPWQVFTETLQSEFKQSKEWNESTKALGAGVNQFTESESVKRARQAYEASSSAVTGTTSRVLKTTAGAVGKGAAWTWDTSVVKGVRKTANVTGSIIEKSTRPLRETEAYKNVKEVIDDGSSSKYGGWVEKEERRKARELRELKENGGRPLKSSAPAVEDPK